MSCIKVLLAKIKQQRGPPLGGNGTLCCLSAYVAATCVLFRTPAMVLTGRERDDGKRQRLKGSDRKTHISR